MKKVIRLTENDLMRIVKRVMNEQKNSDVYSKFEKFLSDNGLLKKMNELFSGIVRGGGNDELFVDYMGECKSKLESIFNEVRGIIEEKFNYMNMTNNYSESEKYERLDDSLDTLEVQYMKLIEQDIRDYYNVDNKNVLRFKRAHLIANTPFSLNERINNKR